MSSAWRPSSVVRCGRTRAALRSTTTVSASSIGTGLGGGDALIDSVDKLKTGGYRKVSPLAVQMVMPNGPSAVVGLELGPARE